MTVAPALVLGFLLGLKHAVDADHLAAVATIVSERSGARRSSLIGAWWGIGHSLALLPIAIAVIFLRIDIPAWLADVLEAGVALMLIALALDAFAKLARGATVHVHTHRHADLLHHAHPHFHAADGGHVAHADHTHDDPAHGIALRPLLVGLAHGIAGSAALMLIVLATIPERAMALLYVALFALGSTLGMVLTSLALGAPLRFAARRWTRTEDAVRGCAGAFSLLVGVSMLLEIVLRAA
jgi:ABC-type nickel/cobalt efflux system permease component RcnA